jgi:hypothetical protein
MHVLMFVHSSHANKGKAESLTLGSDRLDFLRCIGPLEAVRFTDDNIVVAGPGR